MPAANLLSRSIATWFGCGRSRIAPGTIGSFGALPLHFALRSLGAVPHAAATLGLTLVGVWAAERVAAELGDEDPSSVVIDEVVGTLLALGIAWPLGVPGQIAAFALFRFFDIAKPGPIDTVQRLRPPGVGIMADDVLAGLAAGGVVRVAGWAWGLF
jgi:phosphatidylglycerophosphatase A